MNIWMDAYSNKLVSADEAVKVVKSGDWIDYPLVLCCANELEAALAKRKDELWDVKIRANMSPWPRHCVEADPSGEHFCWNCWHFGGIDRAYSQQDLAYYIPMKFHELPSLTDNIQTDVFMATVSPMDKHGYFNFGAATGANRVSIKNAQYVILEVNSNMPRVLGGNQESIHISEVDYVVESSNPPLPELKLTTPNEIECKIAGYILDKMRNGACMQLGVGGIPCAVGALAAKSDLKDLGVHSEMYTDAFMDMTLAGKISGAKKSIDKYKQVFCFAFGTRRLYDFLDDNPGLASYSVDYVNDPSIIALNDNVISINACLELDLFGQICSESAGTRHISGTGGQLDFVDGAYKSKGGQSFICLPSTFTGKDGKVVSKIKPILTPGGIVTDPRTSTNMIVTEYGTADMKGKSSWERAEALIDIAHPQFRDELIKSAQEMHIWRRSNRR